MLYVNPETQAGFKAAALSPGAKGRETEALKEFEQLFLFEMLKEMRKTIPDESFVDKGGQMAYFEEMMDDFLAGEMATSGQLGVAKQMSEQIHARDTEAKKEVERPIGKAGISVDREVRGVAVRITNAAGFTIPEKSWGVKFKPAHAAGISVNRVHESYRNNQ